MSDDYDIQSCSASKSNHSVKKSDFELRVNILFNVFAHEKVRVS